MKEGSCLIEGRHLLIQHSGHTKGFALPCLLWKRNRVGFSKN